MKVEGSYHGHHDSAQVSVYPTPEEAGSADAPNSVRASNGIPDPMAQLTVVVPFGDLAAVERALATHKGDIAGMIVEPIMMNIGHDSAARRLPVRPQRPAAQARRMAGVRRGQDRVRRLRQAGRPSCSVSPQTCSAPRKRWLAACPVAPSVACPS